MGLRIAGDLSDGAYLSTKADPDARAKLLGVTVGWAALNAVALAIDLRRVAR
jgi:hypothetical protein